MGPGDNGTPLTLRLANRILKRLERPARSLAEAICLEYNPIRSPVQQASVQTGLICPLFISTSILNTPCWTG